MALKSNYTVYIDEGGDPGITDGLHYRDMPHQWMTLGAFVVRSDNEKELTKWVQETRSIIKHIQGNSLHYHKLGSEKRLRVCQEIAKLPARAFCFASHKDNLRPHINPRLGKMSAQEYYNWCSRLLLERIMFWAEYRMRQDKQNLLPLRIIFSQKGGHNYQGMFNYFDKINYQVSNDSTFKKPKYWNTELIDLDMISHIPDEGLAGLQLSDSIASSFHDALNRDSKNHSLEPAKSLKKIIARNNKLNHVDCGLTVWPLPYQAEISEYDKPIFKYYGYDFK